MSSKQMDQSTARRLLSEGGFFVFLGVPEGTEFGIDMKSWNTGEKFRGVKMIPPGLHFIFYSAVSKTEDVAPRTGFFHNFKRSEILVKKWDKRLEDISHEPVSEDEIVRLKGNMIALEGFLGPYPYDILDKWQILTLNINGGLLDRLVPTSGQIRSALELQSCSDADRPRGSKNNSSDPSCSSKKARISGDFESELLPDLKPIEGTEMRLTVFPEKNYPDGSTPSEITQHSLDATYLLEQMLAKYSNVSDIIGELEFCYICFLVGHSLEAFEHWKKLVTLLCNCGSGIKKYRKLYLDFISILDIHIQEIPEDFLADIVSNNNFVYVNLRKFFRNVIDSNVDAEFKLKIERFGESLTETLQWDFDHVASEEEDEAPVVVEI